MIMSIMNFLKKPYEIENEDKCCGNCYQDKKLLKTTEDFPCNKCDVGQTPPPYWVDHRIPR